MWEELLSKISIPKKILIITDELEIKQAVHVNDILGIIWDLDQHLRDKVKYGEGDVSKEEEIRTKLHELLQEKNINLDELYG